VTLPEVPRSEFALRLEQTRKGAAARRLDAAIVIGRSFYDRTGDLAYLTNHFPSFPATAFSGTQRGLGHGLLLLPVHGDPILIIDGRAYRQDRVVIEEVRSDTDLARGLVAALRDRVLSAGRIGLVGEDIMPVAMYRSIREALPAVDLVPADDLVRSQRIIKSPVEHALLRYAAGVADAGLHAALGRIRVGAQENEVCAAGIAAAMEAGADFVRYLRVHSGPYSAYGSRWPQAMRRPVGEGEFVALDIIGAAEGYQFDVLRTTVAGRSDAEHHRFLDAVARAADAAVEAARPGVECGELVRIANGLLAEAGYGSHTRTFMGHGIGLETVEEPYLTPEVTTRLEPGMVLCIEPGLYVSGWGGASIEHEVIITEGRPEVITHAPTRPWAQA
jgi:Xaa-Pro aminopeptidase